MLARTLAALDRDHLIHPVASYRGHEAAGVHVLRSGRGVWITDADGRELLDGFSGLWCVNAGYGQRSLVEAAARQLEELPYATGYFGFGSEPAIRLAAELARLAPGDLNRVYFTLGGSDAIDSVVRLVRFYQTARGRPEKDQMISLGNGYHGSSSTGAGLTALSAFHAGFGLPLAWQHKIASPNPYRHPAGAEGLVAASTAELRARVAELGPDRVAAFFAEPIQGSGGVIVPPPGWLAAMREVCRELDILFVADEVITGFGRTGRLFACEDESVVPDLMTVAKGLTSGYAPMGAVLMSDAVYEVIADGAGAAPVGHGYTYSGHPVSAAVGLATLALYTEGGLVEAGRRAGARFIEGLRGLSTHPLIGEVRGRGLLAALELVTDKERKTPLPPEVGARLFARAIEAGLILRAFPQGILAFAPALSISDEEIATLLERTRRVLDRTLEDPEIRAAMR